MAAQVTQMTPGTIQRRWHWARVWAQAIFRPSVRTFEHIFADPNAQYSRAYLWVFTTVFLAMGAGVTYLLAQGESLTGQFGSVGAALVFGVLPAATLFAVIGGGAWVLLIELWASAMDMLIGHAPEDSHAYERLLYAFAAFLAPLLAVSVLVALFASFLFPALHLVQVAISIYALALAMLAARAVYRASWTRTVLCTLIGAIPLALVLIAATSVIERWAAGL